jgi:hypothetical protein
LRGSAARYIVAGMASARKTNRKKTCFVIMGFGEKTDYPTGRVLNLDQSYRRIIKPAVERAKLTCVRADEIRHSGIIDVPMYEQLLTADVVVADLSTYNSNAIYELGVRHALRPYTTITIAEKELKYPFDLNHIVIRSYEHLGKDVGGDEAKRMRKELRDAITVILAKPRADSPIYTYIKNLTPPQIEEAARSLARGATSPGLSPVAADNTQRVSSLMEAAALAKRDGDWDGARDLYTQVRKIMRDPKRRRPEDHYIIQQLALATYKCKKPNAATALRNARDLLMILGPEKTHDPETLGLLGAVWKRLYELNPRNREALEKAIESYEHGFHVKNDYYNGINLAYLLQVRASISSGDEAVADCVFAQQVRKKVASICQDMNLQRLPKDERYWVAATLEEAYVGLGDEAGYRRAKKTAEKLASNLNMRAATEEQIGKLRKLLDR